VEIWKINFPHYHSTDATVKSLDITLILLLALTWQAGQVYTHFANSARKTVRVFTHSLTLQAGQMAIQI
jgi:hypothetical protein